jgi:putative tryptophan/tyrosine transport system permease protein
MLAGAGAGLVTGILYSKVGINRLLSGILTTMMAYSIAFHILSGRSNIGLLDVTTAFSWAEIYDQQYAGAGFAAVHPASVFVSLLIVVVAVSALLVLLRSNFGLLLRATGGNAMLVESLGRSPAGLTLVGLALSNALIALAGAMVTSRQGFADVNMGTGVVIMLIASVVIGEEISRRLRLDPARGLSAKFCAPILGAFAYFFLYLLILRASIVGWLPFQVQPTDLRFLSAVVLITAIALRGRTSRSLADEALPF